MLVGKNFQKSPYKFHLFSGCNNRQECTFLCYPRTIRFFGFSSYYKLQFDELGSSVSIVSDYGLDSRGSIPDRAKDSSSNLCVQTGSGAHPASYTMGTGGSFPKGKARPGCDAYHSPPSTAKVKKE
jgi:hypothetical protein